ncbi:hypothetical protein J3A83DRAFT_4227142 [Scleroderma citrinum]
MSRHPLREVMLSAHHVLVTFSLPFIRGQMSRAQRGFGASLLFGDVLFADPSLLSMDWSFIYACSYAVSCELVHEIHRFSYVQYTRVSSPLLDPSLRRQSSIHHRAPRKTLTSLTLTCRLTSGLNYYSQNFCIVLYSKYQVSSQPTCVQHLIGCLPSNLWSLPNKQCIPFIQSHMKSFDQYHSSDSTPTTPRRTTPR